MAKCNKCKKRIRVHAFFCNECKQKEIKKIKKQSKANEKRRLKSKIKAFKAYLKSGRRTY